jgi:hypothetical protein
VAQLSGLPLQRLSLVDYRMLPGAVRSVAEALPGLRQLVLEVERVEHGEGRLELAGLAGLAELESWELRLLGGRASAAGVTVAPLPPGATALRRLSSVTLAHVLPGKGEEAAFWGSLTLLPTLRHLCYQASGHATRQPPPELLQLRTLTSLNIKVS